MDADQDQLQTKTSSKSEQTCDCSAGLTSRVQTWTFSRTIYSIRHSLDVRGFRTLWKKSLLTHTSSVFSAHASSLLLLLSTSSLQENHSRSRRTPACPPASLLLRLFWKSGASHRDPAASQPAQSAPRAAAGQPRGSLSRLDAQMGG